MSLSKELLREVLGVEIIEIFIFSKNTIGYYIKDNLNGNGKQIEHKINIHELAHHRCKEWATNNGWYILSYYQHRNGYALPCEEEEEEQKEWFDADTEPEAIFKACEWILEQKAKV